MVLRQQLRQVPFPNDSAVHLAFARWARSQVSGGLPLDGWFPSLGLGVRLTQHYQALPDLLTGWLGAGFGVDPSYRLTLYLLLATWPATLFVGARLMGWDPWSAAAASCLAPLVVSVTGYGFEHSSYTWQGTGLYTQLWGMWLLPPVLGLAWSSIESGRRLWAAGLGMAALIACHFLTAYLALLLVGVFALCGPGQLGRRVLRALAINGGALLLAAPVLVPILEGGPYNLRSYFNQHSFREDSFGAGSVLGWLVQGRLLDEGRPALITALALVGLVAVIRRTRSERPARALLGMLLLSLVLFSGRPSFGPWLALLPGSDDLLFHRFISGVHLAGLLLAGVGLVASWNWLANALDGFLPHAGANLAAAAGAALLIAPGVAQVAAMDATIEVQGQTQLAAESSSGRQLARLVATAAAAGDGRIYAGGVADWGRSFQVGYIPARQELLNYGGVGAGYALRVPSLAADAEAGLDSTNSDQLALLGIRYVIEPSDRPPPTAAAEVMERTPELTLWRLPGGYLAAGSLRAPALAADRASIGRVGAKVLKQDPSYGNPIYRGLSFPGVPAPAAASGQGPASVGPITADRQLTAIEAEVTVSGSGIAVLRSSFDPGWQAEVDGKRVRVSMVVPGFPAAEVPAGTHRVRFSYQPLEAYPGLLLISAAALIGLWLGPAGLRKGGPIWFARQHAPPSFL